MSGLTRIGTGTDSRLSTIQTFSRRYPLTDGRWCAVQGSGTEGISPMRNCSTCKDGRSASDDGQPDTFWHN